MVSDRLYEFESYVVLLDTPNDFVSNDPEWRTHRLNRLVPTPSSYT